VREPAGLGDGHETSVARQKATRDKRDVVGMIELAGLWDNPTSADGGVQRRNVKVARDANDEVVARNSDPTLKATVPHGGVHDSNIDNTIANSSVRHPRPDTTYAAISDAYSPDLAARDVHRVDVVRDNWVYRRVDLPFEVVVHAGQRRVPVDCVSLVPNAVRELDLHVLNHRAQAESGLRRGVRGVNAMTHVAPVENLVERLL
jgi:hypothetical protein